jgi:hypothetical protein
MNVKTGRTRPVFFVPSQYLCLNDETRTAENPGFTNSCG